MDLAAAFERETGCALRAGTLLGMTVLLPADDRFGAFGILVDRPFSPDFQFPTRAYANGVELVLYGPARVGELDAALRRITGAT